MIKVTCDAPAFDCQAVSDGKIVNLSWEELHGGNWLVLFFYPLDFTFVCPTEIIAFSDAADRFDAIGARVAAVSVDSVYSHLAWVNMPRERGGLGPVRIPLIADLDKKIAQKYGVLLDSGVALRGLFAIDPAGKVRHATVNDLGVGRSVDETLRIVEAFQFVDLHGEVCPANWKPGSETIQPDPEGSQKYFAMQH